MAGHGVRAGLRLVSPQSDGMDGKQGETGPKNTPAMLQGERRAGEGDDVRDPSVQRCPQGRSMGASTSRIYRFHPAKWRPKPPKWLLLGSQTAQLEATLPRGWRCHVGTGRAVGAAGAAGGQARSCTHRHAAPRSRRPARRARSYKNPPGGTAACRLLPAGSFPLPAAHRGGFRPRQTPKRGEHPWHSSVPVSKIQPGFSPLSIPQRGETGRGSPWQGGDPIGDGVLTLLPPPFAPCPRRSNWG